MSSKGAHRMILVVLCSVMLLSPLQAQAQPKDDLDSMMTVTTWFFGGGLVLGLSMGAMIGFVSGQNAVISHRKFNSERLELEHRQRFLVWYVTQEADALEGELALGAGAHIEDVASLCGVRQGEVREFGRRLRAQRVGLGALLREPRAFTHAQIWSKLCV